MFRIMYWLSVAVEQINILIDKKIVYSFTYDFAALPGLFGQLFLFHTVSSGLENAVPRQSTHVGSKLLANCFSPRVLLYGVTSSQLAFKSKLPKGQTLVDASSLWSEVINWSRVTNALFYWSSSYNIQIQGQGTQTSPLMRWALKIKIKILGSCFKTCALILSSNYSQQLH